VRSDPVRCVAETGAVAADAGGGLSAIGSSLGLAMKYGWLDLLSSIDQERRGLPHQRWIGTVAGLVSLPAGSLAARGLQWVDTCLSRQSMNFPAWQPVMLGRPAEFGQEQPLAIVGEVSRPIFVSILVP